MREEGIPKLDYSTFLGGNYDDCSYSITLSTNSNSYVVGYTRSPNFPTKNAYAGTIAGDYDAFITKFSLTEKVKKIALIVLGTYAFVFFSIMILIIIVKKRK